ncbi:MAG: glutathione synthase [Neisseriaceae bacterium]|nr:glutathione synthase [Neisseriaceae bacterium]
MNVLFIADPLSGFKIYKDSTYAMMRELAKRGHQLHHCLSGQMVIEAGVVMTDATLITLDASVTYEDTERSWYAEHDVSRVPLSQFDAVIMRTDPPFDLEYLYATQLLTLAAKQGAKVFNSGQAMRDFNEKLAILNFAQFTAPTLVSSQQDSIKAFIAEHQDVIVKPLDGMGGSGIFRLRQDDPNVGSVLEMLTQMGSRTIMAQRYIPEIVAGDKRILVIDGEAMPYALARIPQQGETRGNLAAGGRGVAQPLSERDWAIAKALGPELKSRGILLAGLDVIGDYLTEVNVTSPTCFQEIMQQTDCNVAEYFVDALTRCVENQL